MLGRLIVFLFRAVASSTGEPARPKGEASASEDAARAREPDDASETDGAEAIVAEPASRVPYRAIAYVVAAIVLFTMLAKSGVWDPYELDSADLARRISVNVFHATDLVTPQGSNALPTLSDLKGGELGFTSMALGFKVFGLHDWSGRLPLALWAFAGAVALYETLARFVSKRAGLAAVVALVTMPLYFMQARTMLGDAATMGAASLAFSGLLGALLEEESSALAGVFFAEGLAGLAFGYLARGALLGVAPAALAVGATWLVVRAAFDRRGFGVRDAIGAVALVVGLVAVTTSAFVLAASKDDVVHRALGFALLKKPPTESTFDLPIRLLGHALFPWSAFLPFALGRLFRAPVEAPLDRRERETAVRVAILAGAGLSYAAYAFVAPYSGALPFAGVAILAAAIGVAVHDFERSGAPSFGLAIGVLLLAAVFYHDFSVEPEKALAPFVVEKASFPRSFEEEAKTLMRVATAGFAGVIALSWFERQPKDPANLGGWWDSLYDDMKRGGLELTRIWNGNLLFGLVVVEAAFVGLAAMIFVGRAAQWAPVSALPAQFAEIGSKVWWMFPLVILLFWPLWRIVRDGARAVFGSLRLPRATGTLLAAAIAGLTLSFWYYPALAAQLSPKEVFASYAKLADKGEPLALLGVRNRAASYYAGTDVESFSDAPRAFAWLTSDMRLRKWMVVKADDLPKLNSLYRQRFAKNLPVLDGKSSQILLVSNELGDHANESWLKDMVLDRPAEPQHKVRAVFEDQLETIGWEVRDKSGDLVDAVVPQTAYRLRIFYRVLKPITGSWKAFVHVDGQSRRYNGDHAVLDGKYPMNLWQPGDTIVDDSELLLEPNFTPGSYTLYFGFFSGETRFRVTSGQAEDNRVVGGELRVR